MAKRKSKGPRPKKLPTWKVSVVRIGYGFHDILVRCKTQEEAENIALDQAGNHAFSEKTSVYEIDCTEEVYGDK
jgi:hypothetical protein